MSQYHKTVSVFDVAAYILQKMGTMTAMKLQKLIYYSQAWSLVWDDKPLFPQHIEAWANGPIVKELYNWHRGQFEVTQCPKGNPENLNGMQQETVDSIIKNYGDKSGQWLSELTHQEDPWKEARKGLAPGEPGNNEITLASMVEYYSGL